VQWNWRLVARGAALAASIALVAPAARADGEGAPAPAPAPAPEPQEKPPAPKPAEPAKPADATKPADAAKPPVAPADAKTAPPADPKAKPAETKAATGAPLAPEKPATPAEPAKTDLHAAVEKYVGAPVHGSLSVRYLARWTADTTDQDLIQYVNVGVGDENRDKWSGNLSLRVVEDLDGQQRSDNGENVFYSLNDTFDGAVTALLYTAYATLRPSGGPVEWARIGRQYGYYAETFQFDGASAQTRPLVDSLKLRLTGYAGVPVHFYEKGSSGDWLIGLRAAAEPWKGGRAALDYTHDQDKLSYIGSGDERNDLGAITVWQRVAKYVDLYGRYTWLEGPRDATARATLSLPDEDFTFQASYYQLIDDKHQMVTEFDSYDAVIGVLDRYQLIDVHASKGFGEHFDVDTGVQARDLLPGESEGPFNRDTTRFYVTPTVTDLPWKGLSVSVTYDSYSGGGEDLQTWAADATYKLSKKTKFSAGSDYSLYAFGPLDDSERTHVRTAYVRVKHALTASISADAQYTWEEDDVETFQIFSIALVLDF
jgi:hypothetical protein